MSDDCFPDQDRRMNKGQHTQAELQAMLREYLARDRVILRRLEGWKRVGRVLQRNGEEFLNYLDQLAVNDISANAEEDMQAEVERLLLNFASAASARVDHSRRALKEESPAFRAQYPLLVKSLGESDGHLLLWGIRNYILHVGLPPLTWVGYTDVRPDVGFVTVLDFYLDREALRKIDYFDGSRKKAVLDTQEPMIGLKALVKPYVEAATALDADVVALFERLHAVELEEDRALWREVQTAWKNAGFGAWVGVRD